MRRTTVAAGLAALLALGVVAACSGQTHGTRPSAMRTVLVVPKGQRAAPTSVGKRDCIAYPRTCVNGVGGLEVAYAVGGKPPARPQLGRVMSDINCEADDYGVSHCLNRIALEDGTEVTVRHDHKMSNDPCLGRGERVRVRVARG